MLETQQEYIIKIKNSNSFEEIIAQGQYNKIKNRTYCENKPENTINDIIDVYKKIEILCSYSSQIYS